MVPGSTWNGYRYGDHGIRRWSDDWRTTCRHADEAICNADVRRRVGDIPDHGGNLFRLYDDGRLWLPPTLAGLETAGLDPTRRQGEWHDHHPQCTCRRGTENAAVLAHLVGALSQCDRRHRNYRHGLADAAGGIRWPTDRSECSFQRPDHGAEGPDRSDRGGLHGFAEPFQYRWPVLLGFVI